MISKKLSFTLLFLCLFSVLVAQENSVSNLQFSKKIIAENLKDPWGMVYDPENGLWVAESKEYLISRINLKTGEKTVIKDLSSERKFSGENDWPMGGLMGLSLHPEFASGKPYIYLAYIYEFDKKDTEDGCKEQYGGCFYTMRLVRYTYDKDSQELVKPAILCDSLPASNDHNGGGITIAHVDRKPYLFFSHGDMGAGQYDNVGRENRAQDIHSYEGKVLRFNLEPDGNPKKASSWIPKDNPFNDKKPNAVWSFGHRNPEGIAEGKINGRYLLYSSEHGPFGDDEVNLIQKGKNYGHPLIIGYNDGNYDGFAAGVSEHAYLPGKWNTTYPFIESESETAKRLGDSFVEPIMVLGLIDKSMVEKIAKSRVKGNDGPEWEAAAPSSIAVYDKDRIPGWKNSLLVPSLKKGELIKLNLDKEGSAVTGAPESYFKAEVRYREVAVSPDGSKILLSTDFSEESSNPSEENKSETNCRGCIIEYTIID